MAKIGLKHPVYKSSESQALIAKAIQADIKISASEEKLYADDVIAESYSVFESGTITLGISDLSDAIQAALLGHTITDGELTANISDTAPYVGLGFYGVRIVDGVKSYRAIWFPQVKFSEPEDTNATKGEKISFGTHTIEGTITPDATGKWKQEKTFATEAEAIAYIDALAGITPICTKPASNIASGTYAEAQSVTLTAGAGESIYYTSNGITPSALNGIAYTVPINIAASCALKAIAVKQGSSNSEIATYEYIITA
ncbi:MAG: major tail protein [Eubacteriaceae bacterium]